MRCYKSGENRHFTLWHDMYSQDIAAEPGDRLREMFVTGHELDKMAYAHRSCIHSPRAERDR